ncbi:uncharacterized protein BO80DRAFT_352252 [Aspergillus ibericus CBS 121593]|uniref:5-oxoprolinase n=1 Tax=Aspergillus ibericus CBS 121593 TaxID=1448316 RepID=A0A395H4G1_9EURO|nr:hypothetical protein BO80DRAFT_352252 [Aspergillus ibericus CBS 121593]RAL02530.1 hypothetical protein BO80DRAFT_352252 [Aspergillus ibericus CBS 121593]
MTLSGIGISIDSGGTFTDIHATIPGISEDIALKLLSVDPQNYDDAPTEGIRRVLEIATESQIPRRQPLDLSIVKNIRIGTTVATNALLERKGERSALVITKGFRDLLLIGNRASLDIFGLTGSMPLVLYEKVIEVDERVVLEDVPEGPERMVADVDFDSKLNTGVSKQAVRVLRKPYLGIVRQQLEPLLDDGITSISICFMHSYAYPDHELMVADIARSMGFSVTISSLMQPKIGMVARGQSATVDAYLTPLIWKHIEYSRKTFTSQLGGSFFPRCDFMQNDGGVVNIGNLEGNKAILSGPAGGVLGYASTCYDQSSGRPLIGFDMGGTSTKISRFAGQYEHVSETVAGGVTLGRPQLKITSVPAGGSSQLFWSEKSFEIGPSSAGAYPGPACYRKGGPLTVTDANLLLGRLVPECFPKVFGPSGNEALDLTTTRRMFAELCSKINDSTEPGRSNSTPEEVALEFLRAANDVVCRPIRSLAEARASETKHHDLVAFGGAGGQHACFIASSLGMSRVILHRHSSILSAYGMAFADQVSDLQEPLECVFHPDIIPRVQSIATSLRGNAESELRDRGIEDHDEIEIDLYLQMHYEGSDTVLMIPKPQDGWGFAEMFAERHRQEYGFTVPRTVVVDNVRLRAVGRKKSTGSLSPAQQLACLKNVRAPSQDTMMMRKDVYFEGLGWQLTPIYRLESLTTADHIKGPALVIDNTQTIVVTPNAQATILDNHVVIDIVSSSWTPDSQAVAAVDPLQVPVFGQRFMSIATQMDRSLQMACVNLKLNERLHFSCAILSQDRRLIASVPQNPSLPSTIQCAMPSQREVWKHKLRDGDVLVLRQSVRGDTHLIEITVITPVFHNGHIVYYCTSTGVFAGLSTPDLRELRQEDRETTPVILVRDGVIDEENIRKNILLQLTELPGRNDSPKLADHLANIHALIGANQKGKNLLRKILEEHDVKTVMSYVKAMESSAEATARHLLRDLHVTHDGRLLITNDFINDGIPICLAITINGHTGTADFDFTGTEPLTLYSIKGRTDLPPAVAYSAIMYALHRSIGKDITMNQGFLNAINVILPPQPVPPLRPDESCVSSQRVIDLILHCFDTCVTSPGRVHSLSLSASSRLSSDGTCIPGYGYHETIAGGTRAGSESHGMDVMQAGMTQTRVTDCELLERRYPCLVREFSLRYGSGGKGKFHGGDGCIRDIEFREPVLVKLLSDRQHPIQHGLQGGKNGQAGVNLFVKKATTDGEEDQVIDLGPRSTIEACKGDRVIIKTSGGGGWGDPSSGRDGEDYGMPLRPSCKYGSFSPRPSTALSSTDGPLIYSSVKSHGADNSTLRRHSH